MSKMGFDGVGEEGEGVAGYDYRQHRLDETAAVGAKNIRGPQRLHTFLGD